MALNRTLTELLSSVRDQADMVNSQFVTDAWLTERINAHFAALYDLLVSKGEDYFTVPVSLPVDGSSDNYALPSNFYKLHGVDYLMGGQSFPMKKFMFNERHKYNVVSARLPAQTLTLWITPPITKLVNGSDLLDGVNGWEDYIIYAAAIDAKTKEESDISELAALLKVVKDRIDALSNDRDQGSPERIKDVTSQSEWPWMSQTSFRYRVMGSRIYFIGCAEV
jgi:hypothetical protein